MRIPGQACADDTTRLGLVAGATHMIAIIPGVIVFRQALGVRGLQSMPRV
jgi:hypothetical protein